MRQHILDPHPLIAAPVQCAWVDLTAARLNDVDDKQF